MIGVQPEPDTAPSFAALVEQRAASEGDRTAIVFAQDGPAEDIVLSYQELSRRALAVAALLAEDARPGERALLLYPPGVDFVVSLLGCFYAGVIAVPAYPPRDEGALPRLHAVRADAGARLVLTTEAMLPMVRAMLAGAVSAQRCIATDAAPSGGRTSPDPSVDRSTVAMLQYTSGSIGEPKGVVLTHENLLRNSAAIRDKFASTRSSVAVIWLPPYHDMGLIGGILQPLYSGFPVVLLSPMEVLQRPRHWLETISRHRGTISGGPNFAYELCTRRVSTDEVDGLDLSSWVVAFNGAEPVQAPTLRRFAEKFAPAGFQETSAYPCYGLAEGTLLAAGGSPGTAVRTAMVDGRQVVGCGSVPPLHALAVVDPETRQRRPDGAVGELWLRGPSVAQGYWQAPAATAETFGARIEPDGAGPWLRTGDLGVQLGGELFVTGRLKELIVVGGRNLHPQDVEAAVNQCHDGVRPGCGVAIGATDEFADDSDEQLVVVQEVRPGADLEAVLSAIRTAVVSRVEVLPRRVVLVPPGAVPKTSSGKLRRLATRRLLIEGSLPTLLDSRTPVNDGGADDAPGHAPAVPDPKPWLVGAVQRATGTRLEAADHDRSLSAIGVDSLAAVRIAHECERQFGAAPGLADVLQLDLATLASRLGQPASAVGRDPAVDRRPYPAAVSPGVSATLTKGEHALWLLDRLGLAGSAYQLARAMRICGPVDLQRLSLALERVVRRHPALRSTFRNEAGTPVRVVSDAPQGYLRQVDAPDWSDEELIERCEGEARLPFDLATGPIVRITVFSRPAPAGGPVLLFCAHHLAMDYWSFLVVLDDLAAEYAGAAQEPSQDEVAPPASRIPRDDSAAVARAEQYWLGQLTGTPAPPTLPAARERPVTGTAVSGGYVTRELGADVTTALAGLAGSYGATQYSLLVTAWAAVLAAWTGRTDLVVGCPTAGRTDHGTADSVGYFVNPVALRFDLSGNPGFATLLKRSHDVVLGALAHQDYPFPDVLACLGVGGEPGRNPLFTTMCVLYGDPRTRRDGSALAAMGAPGARVSRGELDLETLPLPPTGAQMDLTVVAAGDADRIVVRLEYADVFDRAAMETLADRLTTVLVRAAENPESSLSVLTAPSARERAEVLALATSPAGPPPFECVHNWFEARVAEAPEAVALDGPEGSISYAELNRSANRLAHRLRRSGIGAGDRVAISADRSVATVVAMIGVLKAGAAYVPLDPNYPTDRLASMRHDAEPVLVLGPGGEDVAAWSAAGEPAWDANPAAGAHGRSPAYVIFTSGSTGRPKGVVVEHRGIVNLVRAQIAAFAVTPASTVLQYASTSFDASVSEIFVTLAAGATLRLADPSQLLPGTGLIRMLADGVTVATLPPSVLAMMPAEELTGLATVVSAGEACTAEVVRRWSPGRRLINAYGPTEGTVCATVRRTDDERDAALIGRALPGAAVYVLGIDLAVVAPGNVGEVYIGGPGVAQGYLRNPGLTAARFIPDPYSGPGARMYRTGDRARLQPDGGLEFLGRVDDQVKLRGRRVEPGEIEAALRTHPAVRQAAVVLRTLGVDQALVAYLGVGAADLDVNELRRLVRSRLPWYMMPAVFVALPELPRTAGGKVDRDALPAVDPGRIPALAPPVDEQQRLVAEVWQEVLGLSEIGIDDNFFDLGGHSLSAARAHGLLQQRLGRDFPLLHLFEFTTVRSLSRQLAVPASSSHDAAEPAARADRRAQFFAGRRAGQGSAP